MATFSYSLEFTIADGKLDEFKEMSTGYINNARDNEPGTLEYQWYVSDDGSKCLVIETFADSDAMMTHLGNVGPTLPALLAIAPITRVEVMGSVNDVAREALTAFGAVHFPHIGGFDKR